MRAGQWEARQELMAERRAAHVERMRERHQRMAERREYGRQRFRERAAALKQGMRLLGQSLTTVGPLAVVTGALALARGIGVMFFEPPALRLTQALARRQRGLLEREFGTRVPEAYRPAPQVRRLADGTYRYGERTSRREPGPLRVEIHRWWGDPAIRRDLRWLFSAPLLGVLAASPALLMALGALEEFTRPVLVGESGWPVRLVAAALFLSGPALAPGAVRTYRDWSAALLAPPRDARLEQRVRRLTETRADAVDAQAAELRRIERDLHDGVQARLVAMGLNLGAVEELMEHDPAAAKALLVQSREASETALRELRGLVRGIHPPVLADRGLADAVRALALDSPLKAEVTEELDGRAEPPVESAVYFAVSELLANAARHADARRVWIDLHHTGDALRVQVTDDGHGGAGVTGAGSGLRGIERRLGTFDGVLALSSPRGGPTIVTLELPCVLSSPRTSTSSEKA
jgi:signal transduction histidine kinase